MIRNYKNVLALPNHSLHSRGFGFLSLRALPRGDSGKFDFE